MRAYTDIELPVSGTTDTVTDPPAGWVKIVYRAGTLRLLTSGGIEVSAGSLLSTVQKTADYSVQSTDDVILCDASAGQLTVTLPDPAEAGSKTFHIKKIDASLYTVRVNPNSAETIDGKTFKLIRGQYSNMQLVSNGSDWYIL